MISVTGIIVPVQWDDKGNILSVAIATHDEDEYLLENQGKAAELKALLRQEVEISGEVIREDQVKKIRVKRYRKRKLKLDERPLF
ncbi:MAG: hypothetical protein JSW39_08385 [Desulfobacterales bacterium]|nr:MAG: hypothetical protein JSW39_08385 [Desulfobacterales bacterium]